MNLRRVVVTAAATAIALLATATGASAATVRYISENGTDGACTVEAPCHLADGLLGLASGDTLRFLPGDYDITTLPLVPLALEGVPNLERPQLTLSGALPAVPGAGVIALRHVELLASSTVALASATVEDTIVHSTVTDAPALQLASVVMRNTAVWAPGAGAIGVQVGKDLALTALPATSAALRNVTILADGPGGVAIRAIGSGPATLPACMVTAQTATADLVNVIARGDVQDAVAQSGTCGDLSAGRIVAAYSNLRPSTTGFVDNGYNQLDDPAQFADATAGKLAQGARSPTIDAGTALPDIGDFDLAGVARILGSAIDIGAFEFLPIKLPGGNGGDGGGNPGGGPGPGSKPFSVKLLKPMGLHLRALLKRGWRLHASCSAACTLALKVTPGTGKQRVLARAAGSRKSAGTVMLRVKITKAGRRALKQKRASWLRFTLVGRDAKGVRRTAKRVLKVRR